MPLNCQEWVNAGPSKRIPSATFREHEQKPSNNTQTHAPSHSTKRQLESFSSSLDRRVTINLDSDTNEDCSLGDLPVNLIGQGSQQPSTALLIRGADEEQNSVRENATISSKSSSSRGKEIGNISSKKALPDAKGQNAAHNNRKCQPKKPVSEVQISKGKKQEGRAQNSTKTAITITKAHVSQTNESLKERGCQSQHVNKIIPDQALQITTLAKKTSQNNQHLLSVPTTSGRAESPPSRSRRQYTVANKVKRKVSFVFNQSRSTSPAPSSRAKKPRGPSPPLASRPTSSRIQRQCESTPQPSTRNPTRNPLSLVRRARSPTPPLDPKIERAEKILKKYAAKKGIPNSSCMEALEIMSKQ